MPGRSGRIGPRPGAEEQVVEADAEGAVVAQVVHLDLTAVEVDPQHLVADAHVDAVRVAELARRAGDQGVDVVDVARHQVGDAAGAVARGLTSLEGDDLEVGALPPGIGGGRHAPGVATDHHESLGHGGRGYRLGSGSGQATVRDGRQVRIARRSPKNAERARTRSAPGLPGGGRADPGRRGCRSRRSSGRGSSVASAAERADGAGPSQVDHDEGRGPRPRPPRPGRRPGGRRSTRPAAAAATFDRSIRSGTRARTVRRRDDPWSSPTVIVVPPDVGGTGGRGPWPHPRRGRARAGRVEVGERRRGQVVGVVGELALGELVALDGWDARLLEQDAVG